MMELSFLLKPLNGEEKRLSNPVEFSCVSSVDTPADSMKAVFLLSSPQEWSEKEIKQISIQSDKRLFHGICDRQIVSLDQNGCRLTIWGRSDAAVLLDNEAIPQEYTRVSVQEMFTRHLAPYGFQNELDFTGSLNNYRVAKGVSEWEAFSQFCQRAVKLRPYVDGMKVSFLLGGKGSYVIGNNFPVSSIAKTFRRSEVISQVLIRDELGRYSTRVINEQAQGLEIQRSRCLIPSSQWAQPTVDARLKMEESMQGRARWEIEIAEILDWKLGEEVAVSLPELSFRGNILSKEIGFSQRGEYTRLIVE